MTTEAPMASDVDECPADCTCEYVCQLPYIRAAELESALISERDARVKAEKERKDFAELVVKIQRQFEECASRSEATEAKLAEALEGHQHESATMAALLERAEAKLAEAVKVIERIESLTPRAANAATAHDLHITIKAITATFLASLKEPSHD